LLRALGMEEETLHAAMKREFLVPGRLQHLSSPAGAEFFIDFAHTHDALQNVLQTLRPLCKGKLTVLFGAGGDRDRTKRPKMGAAAAAADKIILTSDNPRSEDPETIMDDVSAGIPAGSELIREVDRRKALQCAVATAGKGDIVLIAGKGHENTQEIAGVKHHFNEVEILQQLFQKAQE
ncbi:MAG: UDP-N-acetylmuramoyl-L-alanyl-D-glutamate--2,6-diaminopimelate ligase, partial [Lentisphaeria bacterium]|nr:UDP-N-acetylmuramoyl-L-alanyl-D-glutamate--2,6-diaminopimelate ligase [Lentisphaeria bacterium]